MLTPVFANSTPGASSGDYSAMMQFLPFIVIIAIMYFLVIRPQKNKAKQQQDMISKLKKGDQVLTSSGIFGKIYKISEGHEVELEIAEGVRIRMLKSLIAESLSSTEELIERKQITSDVPVKKPAEKAKTTRVSSKKAKDA